MAGEERAPRRRVDPVGGHDQIGPHLTHPLVSGGSTPGTRTPGTRTPGIRSPGIRPPAVRSLGR